MTKRYQQFQQPKNNKTKNEIKKKNIHINYVIG